MATYKRWKVDLDTNDGGRKHVPDPPGLDSSNGRELVNYLSKPMIPYKELFEVTALHSLSKVAKKSTLIALMICKLALCED